MSQTRSWICFLFFVSAPTEFHTLSLHDALPISGADTLVLCDTNGGTLPGDITKIVSEVRKQDRKSTRLNSSHVAISYAVFCLKKKNVLPTFIKQFTSTLTLPQCSFIILQPA